jgi:hypothetical protein
LRNSSPDCRCVGDNSRIRLSGSENRLELDIFKRRGGAASGTLQLEVASSPPDNPASLALGALKPPPRPGRARTSRTRFHRSYPVGTPQARIWNRALSRADEVRRVPGPDPRERAQE